MSHQSCKVPSHDAISILKYDNLIVLRCKKKQLPPKPFFIIFLEATTVAITYVEKYKTCIEQNTKAALSVSQKPQLTSQPPKSLFIKEL